MEGVGRWSGRLIRGGRGKGREGGKQEEREGRDGGVWGLGSGWSS